MMARLMGGAGVLALLGFLIFLYGNSREHGGKLEERTAWQEVAAAKDREIASLNLENANAGRDAAERYADRIAGMEPVIVRSTATVVRFAQTDAGNRDCLDLERVRGIEADAAALGLRPAVATESPDRALHPIPD